jgi:DNA-binding NarL/FixJ family response regulator
MEIINILIADDHPIVREGISARLSRQADCLMVGEANNGLEAVSAAASLKPDIVIMDIMMPQMDGILATEHIKKSAPGIKIIILSMHKRKEYIMRAFQAGADGYILKENVSKEIVDAVKSVLKGERYICHAVSQYLAEEYIHLTGNDRLSPLNTLTLREKEVLTMLVQGMQNREIAEALFISISTVKTHRNNLMQKLGVHDLACLVRFAVQHGFLNSSE